MEDRVAEEEKADRLARLQALLGDQQIAFTLRTVGTRLPVLFDRPGKRPGQIAGRSPYMQSVHVDCANAGEADALFGTIAEVEVVAAHANSVAGCLATGLSAAGRPLARETAGA